MCPMTTITDLFNYVNAHNVSAIKFVIENKNQFDKIKWESKKYGQYILARSVEVHASDCFELLISTIDFNDEIYESSLEIAKFNYFNFESDENFYYVKKILEKKPKLKIWFIKEIIGLKNPNIFIQNIHLIDYNNIIEIKLYLLSCIYHGNINIFELLISNPNIPIKNMYNIIIKEICESKYAKIFLNIMSKYGFEWTQMVLVDFLSMSDNCFEYYLEQLTQLTPEDFKKPEFNKLINYEFVNDCTYYQITRFYHILKLPIEFTKLKESYDSLLPSICKSSMLIMESHINTLYMLFELKPELMKEIEFLNNQLDKVYKKSFEIHSTTEPPFIGIGYIFCQELFHLLKSNGCILRLEYYQALENFIPRADIAFEKWKEYNNLIDKPKFNKLKNKKIIKETEIVV